METFIHWLGVVMASILFINKLYILKDKKLGWGIGAIGTLLAIIYLLLLHFRIMAFAEIGLFILMLYGYLKEGTVPAKVESAIIIGIITIGLVITYFTFSGLLQIIEWVGTISMLIGAYGLTHKWKPAGWLFWFICHVCTAYMAYHAKTPQLFFGDIQIASAFVSVVGFTITKRWVS